MKSTKILALIVSTITLFPSASWADEMRISQKINVNSTITGNGRVISIETNEQTNQSRQFGRYRGYLHNPSKWGNKHIYSWGLPSFRGRYIRAKLVHN